MSDDIEFDDPDSETELLVEAEAEGPPDGPDADERVEPPPDEPDEPA